MRLDHGSYLLDLFPVTLLAGCETGDGKGRGEVDSWGLFPLGPIDDSGYWRVSRFVMGILNRAHYDGKCACPPIYQAEKKLQVSS